MTWRGHVLVKELSRPDFSIKTTDLPVLLISKELLGAGASYIFSPRIHPLCEFKCLMINVICA